MRHPDFDDVIDAIYAAALSEGDWSQALQGVADRFGSLGAAVYTMAAPQAPQVYSSPDIEEAGRVYAETGWLIDSRAQRAVERGIISAAWRRPPGEVVMCDQDVFTAEEHGRDAFHDTVMRPFGLGYFMSTAAPITSDTLVVLTLQRLMRRGAFHDDERRPLGTLMRHLNRALRMQLRLTETGETAATFGARLARSQIASAVVDRLGRVVVSNGAFEVLLRDKAAPVTLRNGVFSPRCVSKAAVHTNLLGLARDPTARRNEPLPTLALPRTSGAPLILELMPLPPALIEPFDLGPLETASTALFIVDPDATVHPPLDLLRQAFRLSPDEAGLAAEMACGLSADEAGRRLGLDRPRAATLAQTLMRKTAARSEAALIAALARLATGAGR